MLNYHSTLGWLQMNASTPIYSHSTSLMDGGDLFDPTVYNCPLNSSIHIQYEHAISIHLHNVLEPFTILQTIRLPQPSRTFHVLLELCRDFQILLDSSTPFQKIPHTFRTFYTLLEYSTTFYTILALSREFFHSLVLWREFQRILEPSQTGRDNGQRLLVISEGVELISYMMKPHNVIWWMVHVNYHQSVSEYFRSKPKHFTVLFGFSFTQLSAALSFWP